MSGETGNGKKVNLHPSKTISGAVDPTAEVRKLDARVDAPTATNAHTANLTPTADPRMRGPAFATSLNNGGDICVGEIIDGVVIANCYRVNVERLKTPLMATTLTATSQSVIGATEISTFAPGTSVLMYLHNDLSHALILGALPPTAVRGKESVHDFIHQAARNRVDEAHKYYMKMVDGGNVANWSSWRPFDATHASEWGGIATTGLKVTLDDFMVQMAVNEFTGVFGFYHDQLLRIGGYNLQTWTAGHERDAYMDQAEYNDTQGYSPYPWEAIGMLQPGQDTIQEYDSSSFMMAAGRPYYSHWENKYENQQPFHRTQNFYGYYGQGRRTVVCAPPTGQEWWTYKFNGGAASPDPYESTLNNKLAEDARKASKGSAKPTQNEEQPPIGLSEDNTGLDGRRFIASAKGITLAKRLLLPVPSRIRRPEDGQGDTDKNYKFAGKYGGGDEHTITGDLEATDKYPHLQRAAGVLDLHGYLFNYAGLHPFHWHAKDYKTWEQSELEHASYNHVVPNYSSLKGSMYLNEPGHQSIKIDHRYNTQNFYASESFISLLEDGGVVIGDGYGAEIRMTAGCVTISAPGDVWLKPGRNAQVWAGRDCIVRADKTVDISATEDNVRIKAEQNVMILAGNDSSEKLGGVLIESRAKSAVYEFDEPGDSVVFGGVVLRAKKAEVITHAKNIYMRTVGGYKGHPEVSTPGNITLDASFGQGTIMTKSKSMFHYIDDEKGEIFHAFRDYPDDDVKVVSAFGKKSTFLNAPLFIDGPIVADGQKNGYSFMARNNIFINKGHIFTKKGGPAIVCDGDCESEVNDVVESVKKDINQILPEKLQQIHDTAFVPLWYEEARAGHKESIRKIEFSFRKDDEYRVDDFELFEDRWQQMARLAGQDTGKWEEKAVESASGTETWPFPGKAKLKEDNAFVVQDFTIVEASGSNLRDKDRGSGGSGLAGPYKEPKLGEPQRLTITDMYLIIK
jgi:hypothetical protein